MKKTILVLMFALSINITKSQCNANFTYSVDPINPLKLTFTSTSTFPTGAFAFEQKWYALGTMIDSLNTTTTITFPASGTYPVKLLVKACVGGGISTHNDTTMYITVTDLTTGIFEKSKEALFSVFPNPCTTGNLTLKRATNDKEYYAISTINGQIIKSGTVSENTETIDIQDLAAGLYFVSCGNKTMKVLKN